MNESDDTDRASGRGRAGTFNLDHLTVAELTEVIRRAEALRQEKQEEAKAALLAKWQAEAAENNLSFNAILAGQQPTQGQGRKVRRGAGAKAAAKFRNPETGDTWSGRGREPNWLKGKNREDFKLWQSGAVQPPLHG
jgi:DNA-binding protein H-NS